MLETRDAFKGDFGRKYSERVINFILQSSNTKRSPNFNLLPV